MQLIQTRNTLSCPSRTMLTLPRSRGTTIGRYLAFDRLLSVPLACSRVGFGDYVAYTVTMQRIYATTSSQPVSYILCAFFLTMTLAICLMMVRTIIPTTTLHSTRTTMLAEDVGMLLFRSCGSTDKCITLETTVKSVPRYGGR